METLTPRDCVSPGLPHPCTSSLQASSLSPPPNYAPCLLSCLQPIHFSQSKSHLIILFSYIMGCPLLRHWHVDKISVVWPLPKILLFLLFITSISTGYRVFPKQAWPWNPSEIFLVLNLQKMLLPLSLLSLPPNWQTPPTFIPSCSVTPHASSWSLLSGHCASVSQWYHVQLSQHFMRLATHVSFSPIRHLNPAEQFLLHLYIPGPHGVTCRETDFNTGFLSKWKLALGEILKYGEGAGKEIKISVFQTLEEVEFRKNNFALLSSLVEGLN